MSRNEVTGDMITVGAETDNKAYEDGWDRIFGKKKEPAKLVFTPCVECPPDKYCKHPLCKNLNQSVDKGGLVEITGGTIITFSEPQDGCSRKLVFEDNPALVYNQPIKFPEGTVYKPNVDKDSY